MKNKGFTLIELIVALIICAVIFIIGIQFFVGVVSLTSNGNNENRVTIQDQVIPEGEKNKL